MAELGRREEFPDLHDRCATLGSNVLQDDDEGRETVVSDLLAMPCGSLPLHIQVFKADDGILLAELMRQLVMVVPALILRLSVQPVAGAVQRIPMVRMQPAPAPRTAELPAGFQPCTDKFRLGDVLGGIRRYEHLSLEAEVEPDAFTQSGLDFLCFYLTDEVDVDVAEMVALDRHGLDCAFDVPALEIAVLLPIDDDSMRILIQCPSCLLQREGFVLSDLLELRRADFPLPRVFEEQLVGTGNPVSDILHGLRADFLEIRDPLDPLELRQMLL